MKSFQAWDGSFVGKEKNKCKIDMLEDERVDHCG